MSFPKSQLLEQKATFRKYNKDLLEVLQNDSEGFLALNSKRAFRDGKNNRLMLPSKLYVDIYGNIKPLKYEEFVDGVWYSYDRTSQKDNKIVCLESRDMSSSETCILTFEEVLDEYVASSGFQMEFLDEVRDAVIDKYVGRRFDRISDSGKVRYDVINVDNFDVKPLMPFYPDMSRILSFSRDEKGKYYVVMSNSLSPRYEFEISPLSLRKIQLVGEQLFKIELSLRGVSVG